MSRILVVEDDKASAQILSLVLTRRGGHEVRVSLDPAEVLDLCHNGQVDLVMMDVSLRGARLRDRPIDGVALARRLKDDPLTACIPTLLVTAHAMKDDRERLLAESRADGYIAKPITDHDELLRIVQDHVERAK